MTKNDHIREAMGKLGEALSLPDEAPNVDIVGEPRALSRGEAYSAALDAWDEIVGDALGSDWRGEPGVVRGRFKYAVEEALKRKVARNWLAASNGAKR